LLGFDPRPNFARVKGKVLYCAAPMRCFRRRSRPIIEALTAALAESSGAAREHIQVIVQGVSPKHWGIAGQVQG